LGVYFDKDLFRDRLSRLLADNGDTTYKLAAYIGMSAATVSRYTTGEIEAPKLPTIEKIAQKYNVNPLWLMGQPGQDKYAGQAEKVNKIPIVGVIAAGMPMIAQENIEGYEYIPHDQHIDFCLRVKGDSMTGARILDGDTVYIRQQPEVENGEIAAVLIDNENATLKRVYVLNGSVILRAENPNDPDQVFNRKEARGIKIIGKAIMFKSEVR